MSKRTVIKTEHASPVSGQSNQRGTRFVLNNPEAHEVFLAGSFNDWHPGATPMIDLGHGRWVKELTLPPGRYEYQFVVDGHWMHDRTARETVDNPMGGLNSVVEVPQDPIPNPLPADGERECSEGDGGPRSPLHGTRPEAPGTDSGTDRACKNHPFYRLGTHGTGVHT